MKLKPSEKVIGHCNKCRAVLRVGRRTDPINYQHAAASMGWRYDAAPVGFVSIVCHKCLTAEARAAQGVLAL